MQGTKIVRVDNTVKPFGGKNIKEDQNGMFYELGFNELESFYTCGYATIAE